MTDQDEVDWCVISVKGVENADALAEVVAASIGGVPDAIHSTPGGVEVVATPSSSYPSSRG